MSFVFLFGTLGIAQAEDSPKYVFLFIGDGMSLSLVHATEMYLHALKSDTPGAERLSFTSFPVVGLCTTYDAGRYITDSASAITAIMSGQKTLDGVLNMDPTLTTSFTTFAEEAKAKGMKIGVLSTVSLDHATPAGLYAHQPSRNNYYEIALEIPKSGFDFFAGGGFREPKGKKGDQRDILEILQEAGYTIITTREAFERLAPPKEKVIVINPNLDRDAAMPYTIDRDASDFSLAELTKKAIELLDNPQGFFMMVEGGKIDWACHANDAKTAIGEVLDFEQAVAEAVAFAQKHPEETLIVVTADHGNGGLSLGYALTGYDLFLHRLDKQRVSYLLFTEKVRAWREATPKEEQKLSNFLPIIEENFGLHVLPREEREALAARAKEGDAVAEEMLAMALDDHEIALLERAFTASMSGEKLTDPESRLLFGGYDPLTVTLTRLLAAKSGLGWTTFAHTAEPVPVFAMGKKAEIFDGYYDNTDLYRKFQAVLGLVPQESVAR